MRVPRTILIISLMFIVVSMSLSQNRNVTRKRSDAQQTATTSDGRPVILNRDGTWEYVGNDSAALDGELNLRERLALTRDYLRSLPFPHPDIYKSRPLQTDYLSNRLACPSMPLADNVVIVGTVKQNGQTYSWSQYEIHRNMMRWLREAGDCKDYHKKIDDNDLTFDVNLDNNSQKLVWEKLRIKTSKLEAELLPCALDDAGNTIFETWKEGAKQVMFQEVGEDKPHPIWAGDVDKMATRWEKIKPGQCVSVRGALVVNCLYQCMLCTNDGVEIHPAYEVKLLPPSSCQ